MAYVVGYRIHTTTVSYTLSLPMASRRWLIDLAIYARIEAQR